MLKAQSRSLLGVAVCSLVLACRSDTVTSGMPPLTPTDTPPPAPSPPPPSPALPWTPSFPAVPAGAVVYDRTSGASFEGAQRFVLFADSTFSLQFALRDRTTGGERFLFYGGVFTRSDSSLGFSFYDHPGSWTAKAVIQGDTLTVDFIVDDPFSALEDGVYVRAPQLPPSVGGRIAFTLWSGSTSIIYTMDPDGSGLTAVTEGLDPSISPDGKNIAFWRYDSKGGSIYIANADGSRPTNISTGYQPTWSPDGRKLAYGCGGICIVSIDGTGETRVTPAAPESADEQACVRDSDPAWSPDGSTIAFTHWPDEHIPSSMCLSLSLAILFPFDFWTQVWLADADGSNVRPLRVDGVVPTFAGWPSWSPDGARLAFYYVNGREERIDVVDLAHSGFVTAIRRSPVLWNATLGSPAWSPDGAAIIFGTNTGWGFAQSSGTGHTAEFSRPGILPYSFSWSWGRK